MEPPTTASAGCHPAVDEHAVVRLFHSVRIPRGVKKPSAFDDVACMDAIMGSVTAILVSMRIELLAGYWTGWVSVGTLEGFERHG
jgi:hypothetical protein